MNNVETLPPQEEQNELSEHAKMIVDGAPSNNTLIRQMQLAVEMALEKDPTIHLTNEGIEQIIMDWISAEDKTYSKHWRTLLNSPEFKTHPKFQGQPSKVTREDFEFFCKNEQFPI